ncbi:CaiF/GrlA family transcriptional regulator, partial [Salmonella enterica]|nr:CaiF/GrlA family transcriptional regulator [Salmonella enterica]
KTDKKKYNNKVINTAEYAEDKVNSSGFLMKCSQSNHEECRVPADTQPRDNEPLYLVIARWCQPQNRWITSDDIAAFYLTAHQVSLQLSYLSQKKNRIACRARIHALGEQEHNRNEIWGNRIMSSPPENCATSSSFRCRSEPAKLSRYQTSRVGAGCRSRMSGEDNTQTSTGGAE